MVLVPKGRLKKARHTVPGSYEWSRWDPNRANGDGDRHAWQFSPGLRGTSCPGVAAPRIPAPTALWKAGRLKPPPPNIAQPTKPDRVSGAKCGGEKLNDLRCGAGLPPPDQQPSDEEPAKGEDRAGLRHR